VDGSGNVYMAGGSCDRHWGTPENPHTSGDVPGDNDAFAAKLTTDGVVAWNTFLGGSTSDNGVAIALDGSGNIYMAGDTHGAWGSPVRPYTAGTDVFVARLAKFAPTATPEGATPTPTEIPTVTATPVPTTTATVTPASTATETAAPALTATPVATTTATVTATATLTAAPTATPSPTATATPSATTTPAATTTPTSTSQPTPSATATPAPFGWPLPSRADAPVDGDDDAPLEGPEIMGSRSFLAVAALSGPFHFALATASYAADHEDSPQGKADPSADFGDAITWMSLDARVRSISEWRVARSASPTAIAVAALPSRAVDVSYSVLAAGQPSGVTDGVPSDADGHVSVGELPFYDVPLALP
jgi:Beta-propeller repeat